MTGSTIAEAHNETTDHLLKGVTINRINHHPFVVFQKGPTFSQRWIDKTLLVKHLYRVVVTQENKNFASHKPTLLKRQWMETQRKGDFIQRFPRLMDEGEKMQQAGKLFSAWRKSMVGQDNVRSMKPYQRRVLRSSYGDKQYVGTNSGMVECLTSSHGKFGSNMDLMDLKKWDRERKQFRGHEDLNSAETPEIPYLMGQEGHMERVGRVSSGRRMSMIIQDNIRSMKPYQRRILKSAYGYKRYVGTNPGMTKSLTSSYGKFGSNMDLMQGDRKQKDFRGSENLSSPEVPEIVRKFDQHGLKPFRQRHLPVSARRKETVDNTQADILYAIPPRIQDKSKSAGGYFDSISTKTREYPKPAPLNGDRMSFYETTQIQNPIWEKRGIGEKGISIDYNKVADHVYEILTRRIIREKERMGELL